MRLPGIIVALAVLVSTSAHAAKRPKLAKTLDGAVASVNGRPILLSEIRFRAKPLPVDEELVRQIVERLIDELLVEEEAVLLHITVTPGEVDQGVVEAARAKSTSPHELIREAKDRGVSEQDFRDDVRRRVLDAKWVERGLRPRVTASMPLEAVRKKRLEELRRDGNIEVYR